MILNWQLLQETEQNVFAINFNTGNFGLQTLRLSGTIKVLDSGAFTNHKNLKQVYIGNAGTASQLTSVGEAPFSGCGANVTDFKITYYYPTGSPFSDSTVAKLKSSISSATINVEGIAV